MKKDITEAMWADKVVDLAHIYDWKVAHFRPCQTKHGWRTAVQYDGKGFPDLVLCHESRGNAVLFRELKAEGCKPTPEQKLWGDWLTSAGADYRIWQPSDWDLVMATLAVGSRR